MKNEICIVTKKNFFLKGNFKCICLVTPQTCFLILKASFGLNLFQYLSEFFIFKPAFKTVGN